MVIIDRLEEVEIMTRQEAINIVSNFLLNHLVAGNMIDDECYEEEVRALAKLYPKDKRFQIYK
jgi:hypothetical protein